MINASPVELVWTAITALAFAITLDNLRDSYGAWSQMRSDSRRRIQAWANFRREIVRLTIVTSLFILVIPALQRPGDVPLSPAVMVIMVIPVGMALNSYLDRRTRRRIAALA